MKQSPAPDPALLLSLRQLALAAQSTVDSWMAGRHKTRISGRDQEFLQYRAYQPGDDLRALDWKMYGRSDRYYVRESRRDANIRVRIVLDASGSMDHPDGSVKKIDYARFLAAALAYLAALQQDELSLTILNAGRFYSAVEKNDHHRLERIYQQLSSAQPGGAFTAPQEYKVMLAQMQRKELVIMITDFYQQQTEIMDFLKTLTRTGNEIMVCHLMGSNELSLDYGDYHFLQDLETGEIVRNSPGLRSVPQRERLAAYLAGIRDNLHAAGIFYKLADTSRPLDLFLTEFLSKRNRLTA